VIGQVWAYIVHGHKVDAYLIVDVNADGSFQMVNLITCQHFPKVDLPEDPSETYWKLVSP